MCPSEVEDSHFITVELRNHICLVRRGLIQDPGMTGSQIPIQIPEELCPSVSGHHFPFSFEVPEMGMKKGFTYFNLSPSGIPSTFILLQALRKLRRQQPTVGSEGVSLIMDLSWKKVKSSFQHQLKHAYFELESISKIIFSLLPSSISGCQKSYTFANLLGKERYCFAITNNTEQTSKN